MQPEYLCRLGEHLRQFIIEVEEEAGVEIRVILDPKQNGGGPTGQGKLAVTVDAQSVSLFAPTDGYFPDGAVRHEVLHVQRFHVEGVPKLVLAESADWDKHLSDALGGLDNAIEHVLIVPVELRFHPERREHWESVMRSICEGLPNVPDDERDLAVCLHWTFLRNVLPDSPSLEILRTYATKHGLLEMADQFADRFMSVAANKEELVRVLFLTFPGIPKSRAALEYVNSTTGTYQRPIP